MGAGAGGAAPSDRMLDAVGLVGPIDRGQGQGQLAAFRPAGVELAILMAPIGVHGARVVIEAFARRAGPCRHRS
jgi:hypothetical protein